MTIKEIKSGSLTFTAKHNGVELSRDLNAMQTESLARVPWHVIKELAEVAKRNQW